MECLDFNLVVSLYMGDTAVSCALNMQDLTSSSFSKSYV
jgi:hypothetical protein